MSDDTAQPMSTREKIHEILGGSFIILALAASCVFINGVCIDAALNVFEDILENIGTPTQEQERKKTE